MNTYQLDKYVEPIVELIDGLSSWYLRRSRRRFWKSGFSDDKKNAYETTYYVLVNICKLIAPAAPVISEYLYKNLTGEESVHLTSWCNIDEKYKNPEILKETEVIQRVISLTRNLREKENIKIRQPLSKIDVAFTKDYSSIINKFKDTILEEVNIKDINILKNVEEIANVEYLPNFKTLGPKYGKDINVVGNLIKSKSFDFLDDSYILSNGNKLDLEDVIVRYSSKSDNIVANDNEIVIKLDTLLTEELKEEGLARELVRNIQDGRKELGLEISDRIKLEINTNISDKLLDYICNETLADLCDLDSYDLLLKVSSNGKEVEVKIKK